VDVERHLAAAFERAPAPLVVTTPDGEVLRANAAACRVLGADENELRLSGLETRFDLDTIPAPFVGHDGEELVVVAIRDAVEAYDEQSAYHDALTGLPNRGLFGEHLNLAIARSDRERTAVAVLAVDLDGFEQLNERLGHSAGDEVLRRVARRLQAAARLSDVAARWSGDEFVVLVGDLGRKVCVPAAEGIALRVEDALSAPIEVAGQSVDCAATVGLAIYPKHVRQAGKLVDAAHAAIAARRRERREAA
jgi:diguanylate cyclase (GGDEF)-like protein